MMVVVVVLVAVAITMVRMVMRRNLASPGEARRRCMCMHGVPCRHSMTMGAPNEGSDSAARRSPAQPGADRRRLAQTSADWVTE